MICLSGRDRKVARIKCLVQIFWIGRPAINLHTMSYHTFPSWQHA